MRSEAAVTLDVALRERLGDAHHDALERIAAWSTSPQFTPWHVLIEAMVRAGSWDELADAFCRVLPFGTGGRRGAVGVGTNRFNPWTLGTSVEGHVRFLKQRFEAPLSVVITYDVRAFHDVGERYPRGIPSPLDGMTSRSLAELAARIYAKHGITAWIQRRDDPTYFSTPELSFLIRTLGAQGGLNVSASHNPPDDNGSKFYDEHGGQLVPPHDQQLLDIVVGIDRYEAAPWREAEAAFRWLDDSHHRAYVDAVAGAAPPLDLPLAVAVTSLHGAGRVHDVLRAAGIPTRSVAAQARPDGRFPTVPGGVANPERPEVFELGLQTMEDDEQLLLATDPDADRIGCMARNGRKWVFLDGNQIAALVIDAVLQRWEGDARPLVAHTEVSSTLLTRVAEHHGAEVRNDLLVGFKYIAEVMNQTEAGRFAVGAEESHGLLIGDAMRDKDAGGGALWLAIAAADRAQELQTLSERLQWFDRELGPVRNGQISRRFEGVAGRAALAALLDGLREQAPRTFAGRKVEAFIDHLDPDGAHGPIRSDTDAASRNVIRLDLAGGARVIFRPSGTEPKLKVYLEVAGPPGHVGIDADLARLERAVRAFLDG